MLVQTVTTLRCTEQANTGQREVGCTRLRDKVEKTDLRGCERKALGVVVAGHDLTIA
jgi:hypothetical protein